MTIQHPDFSGEETKRTRTRGGPETEGVGGSPCPWGHNT